MNNLEECLFHYKKLSTYYDEDYTEIKKGIDGQILDNYRELLKIEMDKLQHQISDLKKMM